MEDRTFNRRSLSPPSLIQTRRNRKKKYMTNYLKNKQVISKSLKKKEKRSPCAIIIYDSLITRLVWYDRFTFYWIVFIELFLFISTSEHADNFNRYCGYLIYYKMTLAQIVIYDYIIIIAQGRDKREVREVYRR